MRHELTLSFITNSGADICDFAGNFAKISMPGTNSSGRHRTKAYIEEFPRLDAKYLKPLFKGLAIGIELSWPDYLKISVCLEGQWLQIQGDVEHNVLLTAAPCPFGGEMWRFRCPRCGAVRRKLVFCHRSLGCQPCSGLRYRVQSISRAWRLLRRHNKYRSMLDPDAPDCLVGWIPDKPRNMHWQTYEAIADKALEPIPAWNAIHDARIGKFVQRVQERIPDFSLDDF